MTFTCQRSEQGLSGILSDDFRIHTLEKFFVMRGKVKYPARFVSLIRSEVKLYSVLFRFTNGLILTNTIH